ncbi:unnamed protein product [Pieris brassicae]|uniref:Uncharacterized protein n=1 Tax=Pieris brassicae TaxID=7116 RepID=A0A9P0XDS4_PIEBR|nr:unnamed protein product [Pieris brassicae]
MISLQELYKGNSNDDCKIPLNNSVYRKMKIKDEWYSAARRCGSVRTRDSEQARECVRAGGGSGGVDRSAKLSPTALQRLL